MREVEAGHWVIQCRACRRKSRRQFGRALDCHEYWRDHVKTKQHAKAAILYAQDNDPNYWSERHAIEALLREVLS
jgi:hypothetical protein